MDYCDFTVLFCSLKTNAEFNYQTERWDTMVSIVPIKKSSLSSHRKDFLDQEPSPSSDCYTGINGLLKAAEVTSLEENRPMEDVIEHGRKSRLDAQPSNNSYSNFYSYSSINESFTEDETIDNASPLGPINLTGILYFLPLFDQLGFFFFGTCMIYPRLIFF